MLLQEHMDASIIMKVKPALVKMLHPIPARILKLGRETSLYLVVFNIFGKCSR